MRIIGLFIFLLFSFTAFGQTNKAAYPDFSGEVLSEVLQTKDWIVIERADGYLNLDQTKDIVIVLQSGNHRFTNCNESAEKLADEERIILVLTSENGEPRVTIQNNKFIARPDEGGMACYIDPDISIDNGKLTIFYEHLRGYTSYIFEYESEDMILVSAESTGVSAGRFGKDYFDFRKGIIRSEKGSISSDATSTEIIPIKFDGFKKLSELGERFDWKVAEYKYL
jgi:hypothetical protein